MNIFKEMIICVAVDCKSNDVMVDKERPKLLICNGVKIMTQNYDKSRNTQSIQCARMCHACCFG